MVDYSMIVRAFIITLTLLIIINMFSNSNNTSINSAIFTLNCYDNTNTSCLKQATTMCIQECVNQRISGCYCNTAYGNYCNITIYDNVALIKVGE